MNGRTILLLACAGLMATGLRAAAQEAGTEASRQLQNLVYYPHRGDWRATGEFTGSLDDSGNTVNDLGTQTSARSTSYQKALLGLSYGLTDGLRLGVTETELFSQHTQVTNQLTGVTTTEDANGYSDPTVTIAQRMHDSSDEGFYADAVLSATPALGHALSATGAQTGNDVAGAWNTTASVPLYYRHGLSGFANEVGLVPSLSRSYGGLSSGQTPNTSTLTSPCWYGAVLIEDRFHFNRSWFVEPGVSINIPYSYETASQSLGATDTQQQVDLNASPSLTVGFLPVDWIMLSASVTYIDRGTDTYPAAGTGSSVDSQQTYGTVAMQLVF